MKTLFRNRRSKRGSSLPMVMAIGAALVIWVLALMPLMATSGTTAAQTKLLEANYLSSRSSIEFVKGELTEMVKDGGIPKTFLVIDEGTAEMSSYSSILKSYAAGDDGYFAYADTDATQGDAGDKPKDNPNGRKVVAICAVMLNGFEYDITITTYNKGEEGLVYHATFTPSGNIMISPESYKRTQALPLSDFVVVDGKIGKDTANTNNKNIIWNSTLISDDLSYTDYFDEDDSGKFTKYKENFKESLLAKPLSGDVQEGYADSGKYAAVLKTTAEAAEMGEGQEEEIFNACSEREYNSEKWILPTAADFMWDGENNKVVASADGQLAGMNLDGKITTYYNGEERTSLPTNTGSYRITIGFAGTGEYDSTDGAINALPAEGLEVVSTFAVGCEAPKVELNSKISSATYNASKSTLTVSLSAPTVDGKTVPGDVYYAYSKKPITTTNDLAGKKWQSSPEFTLTAKAGDAFYFYVYRTGNSEGIVVEATDITFVGTVVPFIPVTQPEDGKSYTIYGEGSNDTHYELRSSADILSQPQAFTVKNNVHVLSEEVDFQEWSVRKDQEWSVRKVKDTDYWQIYKDITPDETDEDKKQYVYLKVNRTESEKKEDSSGKPYITYTYSIVLQTGNKSYQEKDSLFTITNSKLHLTYSAKESYWEWEGFLWWGSYKEKTRTYTGYLSIKNNGLSFPSNSSNGSTIRFFEDPGVKDAPNIPAPTYKLVNIDMDYDGKYSLEDLAKEFPEVENLYVNGTAVDSSSTTPLSVGEYSLYADVETETNHNSWKGIPLGALSISPVEFNLDEGDISDISIDLSAAYTAKINAESVWSDMGGTKYYGFYPIGELEDGQTVEDIADDLTIADFYWTKSFTIEELQPGYYLFAIAQGNTNNSTNDGGIVKIAIPEADGKPFPGYRVTYPYLDEEDFPESFNGIFVFEIDEISGEVIWFGLPSAVEDTPSRVSLYTRLIGTDEWVQTYGAKEEQNQYQYAVKIKDSIYEDEFLVLPETTAPIEINVYNGHVTSMLSGDSLYFMGGGDDGSGYSINTYGNNIYLRSDLLVIKAGIARHTDESGTERGRVIVNPYDNAKSHVMLFTVHGFGHFKAMTFYMVPRGANIANATQHLVNEWEVKDDDGNLAGTVVGGTLPDAVEDYFRSKKYTSMNADIAYATNEQLAHVVSGEAIGWTNNGVLSGKDGNIYYDWISRIYKTDFYDGVVEKNSKFVVCAYVNEFSSSETIRLANRILIAAAAENDYKLNVGNTFYAWTRYLSIDAKSVNKIGSGQFKVMNLADRNESNAIEFLEEWFGANYNSDTVQVDIEKLTKINGRDVNPLIYRVPHNTDLLGNWDSAISDLMVSYDTTQVSNFLQGKGLILGVYNKTIQERYLTFTNSAGNSTLLINGKDTGLTTGNNSNLQVYSNYVFFDGISQITINVEDSWLGGKKSELKFNTLERGYSTNEYLGYFKSYSAENYHGVMLRFGQKTEINYRGTPYTVGAGFYFLPAEDLGDDGMSIATFAANQGKYWIDPDSDFFKRIAYINADGSMGNAYVDTGLEGGSSITGGSGFSGGGVQ